MGAALRRDRYTRDEGSTYGDGSLNSAQRWNTGDERSSRGDGSIRDGSSQVEDPRKLRFRHRLNQKSPYNYRSSAGMCNDVGTHSSTIIAQPLQQPRSLAAPRTHNDAADTYNSSYSPLRTVFSNSTPQLHSQTPEQPYDVNCFSSNTPYHTHFSNSSPQQQLRNDADSYRPIRPSTLPRSPIPASALNQRTRRDELPYQEKPKHREFGSSNLRSEDADDMGLQEFKQFEPVVEESIPCGEHIPRGRQRWPDYASDVAFGAETRNRGQPEQLPYGHRGAYRSSGPTPSLLQNAADSVKQALAGCANHIFRFIRSETFTQQQQPEPPLSDAADGLVRLSNFRLPSIDPKRYLSSPYDASQWKPHREMTVCKLALRAFLSSVFFSEIDWGFRTPEFLRPDELKRGLFEIYTQYKSSDMLQKTLLNELEKMSSNRGPRTRNPVGDDGLGSHLDPASDSMDMLKLSIQDFRRFFLSKMQSKQLSEFTYDGKLISMWPSHSSQEKEVLKHPLHSDEAFKNSVVRLAASVWLLHKLVFALNPTADIFHVPQGSQFVEDYMADDNDYDANDDPGGIVGSCDEYDDTTADEYDSHTRHVSPRNVALMLVPGFVVGNSIIKSRVICRREKMQVRHPSIDMSDEEASHSSVLRLDRFYNDSPWRRSSGPC